MQSGSPEEIKREVHSLRANESLGDISEERRKPSIRSRVRNDPDNVSFYRLITKSGWLLLVTKLILAVVVEKVAFENTIEGRVASAGLLLKDTLRRLYLSYGFNLIIGIALGVIADCCWSKKIIMVLVLCLSIGYYFFMVVGGLEPTTTENPEFVNRWPSVFLQTSLHSIRGIETAAMLESLKSANYKLLYGYTFLKVIVEGIGKTVYVAIYVSIASSENSAVISNFVCLFLCMVVFFIWIIFATSLRRSGSQRLSLTSMRRTTVALMWKLRLNRRNKNVVDRKIDRLSAFFIYKQTHTPMRLLYLTLFIIPSITTGFLYHAPINIFRGPFSRLLASEYNTLDLVDLSQRTLILVMLPLVEFVVVPFILRQILRQKITFVIRLACSMITGVVAYLYGVVVVRMLMTKGSPLPDNWTSEVRFVNALNHSVVIRPTDKSFTSGVVQAKSDLLLTYIRSGSHSILVKEVFEIQLESHFKYVTAVSLEGEECVSYFVTDFMEIQRVPGNDPVFEGPPGTNYPLKARMYFANLDPELSVQLVLTFQHSTFQENQVEEPVVIEVSGGQKKVFQINTGTYILTIAHVDVSKSYIFGPGGVYGVIYSPEVKEETLNYMVVEIRRPKEFSIGFALIYDCLTWIAISFIVVLMEVLVFLKSPHNCRSLAFSFYFFFIGGFLPLCHYSFELAINKSGRVGWWALMFYLTGYVTMCLVTSFIVVRFRKFFALKAEGMART